MFNLERLINDYRCQCMGNGILYYLGELKKFPSDVYKREKVMRELGIWLAKRRKDSSIFTTENLSIAMEVKDKLEKMKKLTPYVPGIYLGTGSRPVPEEAKPELKVLAKEAYFLWKKFCKEQLPALVESSLRANIKVVFKKCKVVLE